MSSIKNAFATVLTFLCVYFSPGIFASLIHPSQGLLIQFTTFAYILGACICLLILIRKKERNPLERKEPKSTRMSILLTGIVSIFLVAFIQVIAAQIEQLILGTSATSTNTQTIIQIMKQYPFFLVATTIAGPIMEELVFRRSIAGILSIYSPSWLAFSISSLLFALAHNDGHYLIYFSIGFFFCYLYKKTGSIWTSIIAHAGMNFLVSIIQLLFVK
ncbi:lysostaphin resistance A-like protein [Vagococcus entomophilus]|uniref:CAAX prenyl protease 2/Lysostaphin resistance protein A-like domain-containing protein n=1 Tax=Vagococcus entomophilus TaxID=1160095 RepID=A0A430AKM7_9ENTE|nr:type II CAAX endopeptidase family protein [Vagococcus entomophilus]RSU08672.1 hypothetical protein CBF30_05450 [Vagococcus entomophilus]